MKALVFTNDHKLTWRGWPEPELGPGEALLSERTVSACGSDIHGYTGESGRRTPPMVMGHEATGEIISLGKRVPIEWLGKRVVINPILYCGECEQCTSNHTNRCLNRRFIGGLNHIITRSYPLSRGAEASTLLEKQRGKFGKVVLTI